MIHTRFRIPNTDLTYHKQRLFDYPWRHDTVIKRMNGPTLTKFRSLVYQKGIKKSNQKGNIIKSSSSNMVLFTNKCMVYERLPKLLPSIIHVFFSSTMIGNLSKFI